MLHELLHNNGEYALALGPGFFRKYAHCGILSALESTECFHPSHISGSSAGAIVGTFLASGYKPSVLKPFLFDLKREDIWDMGGMFGLLKGQLFHDLMETKLPERVRDFSDLTIPLGLSAWDLFGFKTRNITCRYLIALFS